MANHGSSWLYTDFMTYSRWISTQLLPYWSKFQVAPHGLAYLLREVPSVTKPGRISQQRIRTLRPPHRVPRPHGLPRRLGSNWWWMSFGKNLHTITLENSNKNHQRTIKQSNITIHPAKLTHSATLFFPRQVREGFERTVNPACWVVSNQSDQPPSIVWFQFGKLCGEPLVSPWPWHN